MKFGQLFRISAAVIGAIIFTAGAVKTDEHAATRQNTLLETGWIFEQGDVTNAE